MEIKNTKVYGLEESIIRSGYPHEVGEPLDIDKSTHHSTMTIETYKQRAKDRSKRLANTPIGSGHNNFLKGIIVQFDLKYPQYFTPQLQRYHWIDIVSSQSKIHSLTKIKDIKNSCNKYVLPQSIDVVDRLINFYNTSNFPMELSVPQIIQIPSKQVLFQYIISNLPMGFELWMGISTNYLQLKFRRA